VLVQRPSDMRSLSNRFFAASLLGTLAERRYDDATAADYARRGAQAGEDYVRFNPADLTTWGWWVTGLEQVAQLQFERGDVSGALTTYQSIMALKDDRRAPSSLGPLVWVRWLPIAAGAEKCATPLPARHPAGAQPGPRVRLMIAHRFRARLWPAGEVVAVFAVQLCPLRAAWRQRGASQSARCKVVAYFRAG